jgi:4-methylaminobutanoate oxidase (formaldehyde-forming)
MVISTSTLPDLLEWEDAMERLADRTLSAASFASAADVPASARTVIIGGGIIGASVAYHLAELGETDVALLERNVITSGTTWHAAGLIASVRSTPALTELARYGIDLYSRLENESGVEVSFSQCGSLSLARTSDRADELRYTAAVARQQGVPAHPLGPREVQDLWPLAATDDIVAALHQPLDGTVNPGYAAVAMAKLAHEHGVAICEGVDVLDIDHRDGRVTGVVTNDGTIACERVVLAGGLWTRDLAARCRVTVPLYAAEHVHLRSVPITGAQPRLPVLRDMDGYFYVRHESGRLLVGAFEPNGIPRGMDEIAYGGFAEFPPDWEHVAPVRGKAEQRVPALRGVEYDRFVNAPESFTPDGNFCLGATNELDGCYVAAGFNSQGIIFAPGAGKALAEWIRHGSPTFDASAVDVQRFAHPQGNRRYLHARTKEGLGRLYAMHWPHGQPATARNVRRTPLHERLVQANACFGEAAGWEQANWYAPAGTEPEYRYSYGRQNWFDAVGEEHRAAREQVAMFDLSSCSKFELAGPDALDVLQQLCTADLRTVDHTLFLNVNGGIELDATVVRIAADRFWIISSADVHTRTRGLLDRAARGRAVGVFDATAARAAIAVVGPRSHELMTLVSPDDWTSETPGGRSAREIEVGDGYALCLRVTVGGEPGYQLYPTADQAINIYDALVAAGRDLGLRHAGYHALESLRIEAGVAQLGHEFGPHLNPYESREHRIVYVALRDPEPIFVQHESIHADGELVGALTSGSYGYTLGRACGIGRIRADVDLSASFTVDCGGQVHAADISLHPLWAAAD